jgi:hypothetical protein
MVPLPTIVATLHRLYIAAPGAGLRREDRKKAAELAGLLDEIERVVGPRRGGRPFALVDAAAGKAYVGLLVAELILAPRGRAAAVTVIERDGTRAAGCQAAAAGVNAPDVTIQIVQADVEDKTPWPDAPDLVVALHACGPAADAIVRQAVRARARHLLLVPCCTSAAVTTARLAERRAEQLGLPGHAEVQRRFIQSFVDGARTLALEAAGYQTEVVPFVPPTLTPHNLLWRARRVGEPARMAAASEKLARLLAE